MKFHLARLIIWPRDETKTFRVVAFEEAGINLVAGASRSGKSAIIKIIDYCLGSRSCSIPKLGPIRRSSAWYGIVVNTNEGYKLLARRDPGNQESTDDFMIVESAQVVLPDRPEKNSNRDAVKGMLARLARLPQANTDFFEGGSGYRARASFGDMTAFLFQPQSVVANENVLFFETEEEEHARKLREVFPLVLGAVDADLLVRQHRLAEVRRQLERHRRQVDLASSALANRAGAVRGRYLTAVELGFVPVDAGSVDDVDVAFMLRQLRVLRRTYESGVAMGDPEPTATTRRVATLREREIEQSAHLAALKSRLVQLRELSQARRTSEKTTSRERDRLGPASWLVQALGETALCPFCGSGNQTAKKELDLLREHATRVEAEWRGMVRVSPMLDAEEVEVNKRVTDVKDRLAQLRTEREQLEKGLTVQLELDKQRALYIGGLGEFLANQNMLADDGELATEISRLEAEELGLRTAIDAELIEQRKEDALLLVSRFAQIYGGIVELEDPDAVIRLDIRALKIRILSESGESAWLHQVGSGANHLGYHVAVMLALHEFFIQRDIPYVPSLLVLDQPSQTQFPDDLDEEAEQEELIAVRKAFEAFDHAVERTNGRLQVIVSEHGSKTISEGIRHLSIVERWRRGRKLIPWHWDSEALSGLEGKRADYALEDLIETHILPAVATHVGVSSDAVAFREIRSAMFHNMQIFFGIDVEVSSGENVHKVRSGQVDGRISQELGVVVDVRWTGWVSH